MENNNKETELERKLKSKTEWRSSTFPWIIEHFVFLGFKCPKDFFKIRFFDFFNLDCVDNNRAEEMLTALIDYLYPDRIDRCDYEERLLEKKYIRKWIREHKSNINNITIGELMNDDCLSKEGFLDIFDVITQSFYHSKEYDSRKYKYQNVNEIPSTN